MGKGTQEHISGQFDLFDLLGDASQLQTIIPSNFPIELQLQFLLWDPLGPPRGVPEGPRGSQGDPEEELRSVFKGKVARNNGLKNGFFQFLM